MYVRKYLEEADTKFLTGALLDYDSEYRQEIQIKVELKKISLPREFFSMEDHFCETPYILEFWVCGKNRCKICARVGRKVHTHPR